MHAGAGATGGLQGVVQQGACRGWGDMRHTGLLALEDY